ncbi:hypothetical protein EV424DRAFT_1348052 [Suillus variegatus]|nr:hypothetical protein EV424DRAFT_1348052 [Suillus variegatus]
MWAADVGFTLMLIMIPLAARRETLPGMLEKMKEVARSTELEQVEKSDNQFLLFWVIVHYDDLVCYDTRSYADLDGSNSDSQDNGDQRCCGSVGFHKQAEVAYALWGDGSNYRQKVRCRGKLLKTAYLIRHLPDFSSRIGPMFYPVFFYQGQELELGITGHESVRMTDVNGEGDVVVPGGWDAGGDRENLRAKDWAASRPVTILLEQSCGQRCVCRR